MRQSKLSQEILMSIEQLRSKHKGFSDIQIFLSEDKDIVALAKLLGYNLSTSSLTRLRNWAQFIPGQLSDERAFKKNNSISAQKLKEVSIIFQNLTLLSSKEIEEKIQQVKQLKTLQEKIEGPAVGLESFIGEYISFHPNLTSTENTQILQGELILSSTGEKNKYLKAN